MIQKVKTFASESVCAGHPDKVADQISDAILDAVLSQDPNGKTAVETLVANNRVILAGEINTTAKVNFEDIARQQIKRLGYLNEQWDFSYKSEIENYIHAQSADIAVGVEENGAGDQGMMFGYACRETDELMPLPIMIAHRLTRTIDELRENRTLDYLRPDGKAQVVVKYKNSKPVDVQHVTIAVPHDENKTTEEVKDDVYKHIVIPVLESFGYKIDLSNLVVNGTGVWHIPGPSSDCGLTGRKIVVDGYGGYARVGGGAFSGKDPSKVDRSGAYAARYIAKNIVAANLAGEVEVGLAYYIGAKKPVNFTINTFGSAKKSDKTILNFANKLLVPSLKNIVEELNLKRPIYLPTASYGHFGKQDLPWEQIA